MGIEKYDDFPKDQGWRNRADWLKNTDPGQLEQEHQTLFALALEYQWECPDSLAWLSPSYKNIHERLVKVRERINNPVKAQLTQLIKSRISSPALDGHDEVDVSEAVEEILGRFDLTPKADWYC